MKMMSNKLHKFLNGFMIAIVMFATMAIFLFIGMVLPLLFAMMFGPFIGILTLLIAIGVIGGLASLLFEML